MLKLLTIDINTKYQISLQMPNNIIYKLDIYVMNIEPNQFGKSIKFKTLKTSPEILPECGYNPITIPMCWITDVNVLNLD